MVLDCEELIQIDNIKVLPSFLDKALLKFARWNRIREKAEDIVAKLSDDRIKDCLILVHLLLVQFEVERLDRFALLLMLQHVFLHEVEDGGEKCDEE